MAPSLDDEDESSPPSGQSAPITDPTVDPDDEEDDDEDDEELFVSFFGSVWDFSTLSSVSAKAGVAQPSATASTMTRALKKMARSWSLRARS